MNHLQLILIDYFYHLSNIMHRHEGAVSTTDSCTMLRAPTGPSPSLWVSVLANPPRGGIYVAFLKHIFSGYNPAEPFLTCPPSCQPSILPSSKGIANREACSIHRGGLQRVSCRGGMSNALMYLALALCVSVWHLGNLLLAQNSPAELYCTLTDNLSVNVPRLCCRDAFRCRLRGLSAVLHPHI